MRARLALAALGVAIAGWGVAGLLRHAADTRPLEVTVWLGAVVVAHDLVLAPAVAVVAWVTVRLLGRGPVGAAVCAGLLVGGVLLLVAVPLVLRADDRGDNASALPRDYAAGTVLVLVLVAVGTALAAGVGARRVRRLSRE